MFPSEISLKLYAVMEAEIDVNAYVAGDVHVWPMLRFLLNAKLTNSDVDPAERPPEFRALDEVITGRFEKLIAARPPTPGPWPTRPRKAPPRQDGGCDILFYSRAEDHYLPTPRGFYAPVTDPWIELARERWSCIKAELILPQFERIQPRIIETRGFRRPAGDSIPNAEFTETLRVGQLLCAAVRRWLSFELGLSYPDLDEEFRTQLRNQWSEWQAFNVMLDQVKPRLVVLNCFYGRPSSTLTWAAHRRGIPVAETQHGGNGKSHIGYTHWRHAPANGYLLLPDYFLVWDDLSVGNVMRWLPADSPHTALMTGRFGLEHARRACMGDATHSPLAVAAFGSSAVILITLQPLPSTGVTDMMIEAMRKAPKDWTWLIRCHPMAIAWNRKGMMPEDIEARLKEAGIQRFEVRLSTSLPLAAITPVIKHHVTGFSGAVQECAAFGIRTTFTHPSVWSVFGDYIENGTADFAKTADELIGSIAKAVASPMTEAAAISRDPQLALVALSQILD